MTLARKPWLEFGVSYVQPIDNKRLVSCVEGRRIVAALPPSAPGMALDRQEPKAFLFPPALRDPILASLDQPPPASEDRQAQADQERVLAETLSLAKQAESQRDLEVKKAQFLEVTKRQQAQADKAYDIQTNIMQQQVVAEQVKVQQIEKEQQVKVQEAEINRREKELIATVLKPAEIDRQRIETLAAAEKQRLTAEAEGHASSIRAQGEAESEIIFKKGEAEAKAMNVKAAAYQEYNQAAVIDKLFASMPEIVKALAAPLANVDKITIVSTGNGDSAGMNKITGDIIKMAAQVPALFETLSGMPLGELIGKVRQIGDKSPKPEEK